MKSPLSSFRTAKSPDFGLSKPPKIGFGGYVAILLIAVAFVGTWLYHHANRPDPSQVVLLIHRDGGRVNSDGALISSLSGELEASDQMAVTAYCVNGWYWITDVTLDRQIVVATDAELVRAAELVDSKRFDSAFVEAMESVRLAKGRSGPLTFDEVPTDMVTRFGAFDIRSYLQQVAVAPSSESTRRFVAYAVSSTIWDQWVYVVDAEHLDRAAIRRYLSEIVVPDNESVVIAGKRGTVTVRDSKCEQLLTTLDDSTPP